MKTLTSHLCGVFHCSFDELPEAVKQNRPRVITLLQSLPLLTGHIDGAHRPFKCDGLSLAGPRTLFGRGGQLGLTVEHVFFTLHRKEVRLPQLPCIAIYLQEFEAEIYYPMELTFVDL
jgi:hypothetical protein